jgi:hypothetical protein
VGVANVETQISAENTNATASDYQPEVPTEKV